MWSYFKLYDQEGIFTVAAEVKAPGLRWVKQNHETERALQSERGVFLDLQVVSCIDWAYRV